MVSSLNVFAMAEERQDQFDDLNVLDCGIGKVNATFNLTRALCEKKPDIVINLGTAGSRKHKSGLIINPASFVQRDMDVTPLGFEKFQTPFSSDPVVLSHGLLVPGLTDGVCGTGDNFDTRDTATSFDVVDMEAYALSLVCMRLHVPFLCLKYISDGADGQANLDWSESLKHAAVSLRSALDAVDLNRLL